MFLHLGSEKSLLNKEIIGIFDYNLIKKSRITKEFMEIITNEGAIEQTNIDKKVKSFIVTKDKVFLSPISSLTLQKRILNAAYQNEQENSEGIFSD